MSPPVSTQRHPGRPSVWPSTDSGQLLLVIAGGVLLVAAVAQTAASGLVQPRDALAFGALIALGELLRLSLPGDREAAPIGSAGALGYALVVWVGPHAALQPALQVVAVTAVGMIVGALPHLAAGGLPGWPAWLPGCWPCPSWRSPSVLSLTWPSSIITYG